MLNWKSARDIVGFFVTLVSIVGITIRTICRKTSCACLWLWTWKTRLRPRSAGDGVDEEGDKETIATIGQLAFEEEICRRTRQESSVRLRTWEVGCRSTLLCPTNIFMARPPFRNKSNYQFVPWMIINVESIQSSQSHEKPNFENVLVQSFLITCVPGGLTLCSIADCLFL